MANTPPERASPRTANGWCSGDARARGLSAGDVVRVCNDRGQIPAALPICEDIRRGVIRINEGGGLPP
ncbi:MAG: molybdopterin dinucleotide binding domain-containing protein [Azoarcus sp.]